MCIAGSNLNPYMAYFEENWDIAMIGMSVEPEFMNFFENL